MTEQPNLVERVERLEEQVKDLFSLVQPPTPIEPVQLVIDELGATEVKETETPEIDVKDVTPMTVSASTTEALNRAQTRQAMTLPDGFSPAKVGYTMSDFISDFPNVSPDDVFHSFVSHHRSKGDVSKNWLAKFLSYSANAVRIEKERRQSQPKTRETDSMGLPLDRGARIRAKRAELENHQQRVAYEQDEREDTE